jgi:cation transport ATPase
LTGEPIPVVKARGAAILSGSLNASGTKATGVARISGHGVAATSTARLRIRSPEISQAKKASARVTGRKISA